jgi:hypothetical protein
VHNNSPSVTTSSRDFRIGIGWTLGVPKNGNQLLILTLSSRHNHLQDAVSAIQFSIFQINLVSLHLYPEKQLQTIDYIHADRAGDVFSFVVVAEQGRKR